MDPRLTQLAQGDESHPTKRIFRVSSNALLRYLLTLLSFQLVRGVHLLHLL